MQEEINALNLQLANLKEYKAEMTSQKASTQMGLMTSGSKEQLEAVKQAADMAYNEKKNDYAVAKEGIKAALLLWITILVCGYFLLIYMYVFFINPVDELKNFSEDIARGELDKSLPIHKNNMFGSFVEGFDIMREQVKGSIDRERKSEIARKELIQGLSHDIKTPLAVINATCEVLELKYLRC